MKKFLQACALGTFISLTTCTPEERYYVASTPLAARADAAVVYCANQWSWPADWATSEEAALEFVNMIRSEGGSCGERGVFAPAPPLQVHPALKCAARIHARDLGARGTVSHEGADGSSPFERMLRAGYAYGVAGENVAGGPGTALDVVQAWLDSDAHCAILLDARFTEVGIGHAIVVQPGAPWSTYWALNAASR